MGLLPFWWAGGQLRDWWPVVIWGETFALPALASPFVCKAAPIASSNPWRVIATIGLGAVISAGLWLEAGRNWFSLVSPLAPSPASVLPSMAVPAAAAAVLVFMLSCAIGYALIASDDRQTVAARVLQAEIGAREAELRALRAQVDPHFLFNCLHSISSLIGSDPRAARTMCIELADFFRESLRAGALASIPMATEVDLVRRYLAVERLRFGSRLDVKVEVSPAANTCLVPPLLIQPLAENAVRHGIATLLDGGTVGVSVERVDERVEICVSNPYDADEVTPGTGIGLRNVRARLDTTYGALATLRADAHDGRFVVTLSLPARDAAV
jgi:LytS/YehU family sensor histidine kinase